MARRDVAALINAVRIIGTATKFAPQSGGHGNMIIGNTEMSLIQLLLLLSGTTHLSAEGGGLNIKPGGERTGGGRRVKSHGGTSALLLLLTLSLSHQLCLVLLCGLNFQELQLHHLHLEGLLLSLSGVVSRIEARAERNAVGIHATLLLLRKAFVGGVDGGGHGHNVSGAVMVIGIDVSRWHFKDLVVLFLWERVRYGSGNVERCAWGSGVWD